MANIIVSAHYTSGDVFPLLKVAAALRRQGHQVHMVTHAVFEEQVKQAELRFVPYDRVEDYPRLMKGLSMLANTGKGSAEDRKNELQRFLDWRKAFHNRDTILREVEILSDLCRQEDSVIVARQGLETAALLVAELLHKPLIQVVLAPFYIIHLRSQAELYGADLLEELNDLRLALGLPVLKDWYSWITAGRCNIALWPLEFAAKDPQWPIPIEMVGFPYDEPSNAVELDAGLMEFLAAGEPPILINGSTGNMLHEGFYEASIAGCRAAGRRAVVVAPKREALPTQLPEHVQWYSFLPFAQVLPKVAAIIHHGGVGTLSTAMLAGTPQIALATDTDRPDNGMRLKQMGIGEYLPPILWQPDRIANALERVLSESNRHKCRIMAEKLQKQQALNQVCQWVEQMSQQADSMLSTSYVLERERFVSNEATQQSIDMKKSVSIQSLSSDKRAMLAQRLLERKRLGGA